MSLPALKNSQLEQLNSEFFAWLPTRFSALKIAHLIKQIGISNSLPLAEDEILDRDKRWESEIKEGKSKLGVRC
ncbi:hypothetical protein [Pseudoalteromonas distincta]|uniref:hypothetical protein n=1 Tax=Pseudoalteromonas distincta TaxID=77608 RepID=UPI0039EB5B51